MLSEFCISHSLESCLALSNFSWSHSHIRSPSQNYLLTWLHLAPSLLSTGVFNGSLERHVCTWFKPRYTTHFTLPSYEQQRPRFFLPEKNHRCESHEHTTNFCSWFQPVIFYIFSYKKKVNQLYKGANNKYPNTKLLRHYFQPKRSVGVPIVKGCEWYNIIWQNFSAFKDVHLILSHYCFLDRRSCPWQLVVPWGYSVIQLRNQWFTQN